MKDDPNELVVIKTVPNEMTAGIFVGRLREEGIEAGVFNADGASAGIYGTLGLLIQSIKVRRVDAEHALDVLDRMRDESLDIDWDEVDVGEPVDGLAKRIAAGGRRKRPRLTVVWVILLIMIGIAVVYWVLAAAGWHH